LDRILSDIGHEHISVLRIPEDSLTIADTVSIDFTQRVVLTVVRKGIRSRNPIFLIRTVRTERIDPMNLAKCHIEILGVSIRISSAAAIRQSKIQKPE